MDSRLITGIILAGGKSRRMGVDKRFLDIAGQTLLDHAVSVCEELFEDIVVVTGAPEVLNISKHRVVHDIIPNCAALGGIYTGLSHASFNYGFVMACDMPWVQLNIIACLIEALRRSPADNYDVVIPKLDTGLQPTHAVYGKQCIPHMKAMIDGQDLKVQNLCSRDDVSVRYVSAQELPGFGVPIRAFENINTPDDLEKARRDADTDHSSRRAG